MKRFAMICAAFLMAFGVVQAQNSNLIKAHFSTPVTAGVTELPAGNVTIQVLEISSGTVSLLVRSESGAQTTLLVNRISRAADYNGPDAAVQLERKGDAMVIDQIWISDRRAFRSSVKDSGRGWLSVAARFSCVSILRLRHSACEYP